MRPGFGSHSKVTGEDNDSNSDEGTNGQGNESGDAKSQGGVHSGADVGVTGLLSSLFVVYKLNFQGRS